MCGHPAGDDGVGGVPAGQGDVHAGARPQPDEAIQVPEAGLRHIRAALKARLEIRSLCVILK